jgi:DNA-binding NarL/FixJ family response regulator
MEQPPKELTPRERAVLALVAEGKRNREIAQTLGISEATVENHLHHIFQKLGVSTRTEAARHALTLQADKRENEGNPSRQRR